jgi:putative zincin peptidase
MKAAFASRDVTIDELATGDYTLLGVLTHASLGKFVVEYFLRRTSWLTRAHHLMSLITLVAIVVVALRQERSWLYCLESFGAALVVLFVIVLPLHELVHAIAYRLAGARDVRWDYSARMLAVWVVAHRFVADTRAFAFVALAPFVVINAALIVAAILWPGIAVFLLFVLLWHLHGASGDWALLNFVWLHRARGVWTYDDADAGRSWFYGRV